jgi:hypothetical protein
MRPSAGERDVLYILFLDQSKNALFAAVKDKNGYYGVNPEAPDESIDLIHLDSSERNIDLKTSTYSQVSSSFEAATRLTKHQSRL